MKGLRVFLEHRGWDIVSYKIDTTFLEAKYKNKYRIIIKKQLGTNPFYKTKWIVNNNEYYIMSNSDEKFIFEELNTLGFK